MVFEKYTEGSKNLNWGIVEGVFATILGGAGAAFIIPFAILLGATSIEIGFLVAFPALLSAWFQLFSVKLLESFRRRKKVVINLVILQSVCWIPFLLLALFFQQSSVLIMVLFYSLSVLFGNLSGPLWQSWMKSITPSKILGSYNGFRNSIVGFFSFVSLVIFGYLLGSFSDMAALIFVFIFGISIVTRLISAVLFFKINEPSYGFSEEKVVGFIEFVKKMRKNNFGYFILFGSMMTLSISFVGPFFAVYLLRILSFDYFSYTLIIAAFTISSLISMPYWGILIDKFGAIKVVTSTALIVAIYPICLIFVRSFEGLIILEFFKGVAFSGFSLSLANFIYNVSSQSKIIRFSVYQAVFFGTAAFIGLMLSGYLQSIQFSFFWISNSFYLACLVSVVLGIITILFFARKITDVRPVERVKSKEIVLSALTLLPIREFALVNASFFVKGGSKKIEKSVSIAKNVTNKGVIKIKEGTNIGFKVFKSHTGVGIRVLRDGEFIGLKYVKVGSKYGLDFVKTGGGLALQLIRVGDEKGNNVVRGKGLVLSVVNTGSGIKLNVFKRSNKGKAIIQMGGEGGLRVAKKGSSLGLKFIRGTENKLAKIKYIGIKFRKKD